MNKLQLGILIILALGFVLSLIEYKERRELRQIALKKAKCSCNGDHTNDTTSHYDVAPTQLDVL